MRSHRYECESGHKYTGSSNHEFACIPMQTDQIDTSTGEVNDTLIALI